MKRRRYLQVLGSGFAIAGAGCSSLGSEDGDAIQDSDEDGVIDSEDYAPNDPDVQRKSDLESTNTQTPEQTSTPVPETAMPSPTATSTPTPNPTPTEMATPTPTATPTQSPTPTPTEESTAPKITKSSLVTHVERFGDVEDNAVESVGQGGQVVIGFRFVGYTHNGEVDIRAETSVYDEDGIQQASDTKFDNQLAEEEEYVEYEWGFVFDSESWDQETYTADILIRDRISQETSRSETVEFDIVEPLVGNDAAGISQYNGPETVTAGESFDFEVVLYNGTDRDSSIVSSLSQKYEGNPFRELNTTVNINISSDERGEAFSQEGWQIDTAGDYRFRIDDVDEEWSITVEE